MRAKGTTRTLAVIVAGMALLLTDVTVAAQPAAANPSTAEAEFVELLNGERRQLGLPALRVNTDLRSVARGWSQRMADCTRSSDRRSCLKHNPDYGAQVSAQVTRDWTRIGENVGFSILTGASTGQLVRRLHNALMNSEGHRRNILGSYNQVGIGVAIAPDGSLWVTQNFMQAPLSGATGSSPRPTIPVQLSDSAVPITGDWNGDGRSTAGWYDNGRVYLRNSHGKGGAHIHYAYGRPGDVPITGDWNGDGKDTLGVLRDGTWYLRDHHSGGSADHTFRYGRLTSGDYALAGDWNGDGRDTIGIVRKGEWHLRDRLAGGQADRVFYYGRVRDGDVPVVGDWTGDGRDTPGIVRGSEWHLRDVNRGGVADRVFRYGNGGDTPVVGNWNARGPTTPGIVRGTHWHLRNRNAGGAADISYEY